MEVEIKALKRKINNESIEGDNTESNTRGGQHPTGKGQTISSQKQTDRVPNE